VQGGLVHELLDVVVERSTLERRVTLSPGTRRRRARAKGETPVWAGVRESLLTRPGRRPMRYSSPSRLTAGPRATCGRRMPPRKEWSRAQPWRYPSVP